MTLLTDDLITKYFNQFRLDVLDKLDHNEFILLFLKFKFSAGSYKTLGPLQKINKGDFDDLLTLYKTILENKSAEYHNTPITRIIFSYIRIPSDKLKSDNSKITDTKKNKKVESYKLYGYNFPSTMDLSQ